MNAAAPQTDAPLNDLKESRSLATLREIFESARPLAYLRSPEEQRIAELLRAAARLFFTPPIPVWTWSLTEGMRREDASNGGEASALSPRAALDFVAAYAGPAIFHLKDFHEPLREAPEIRRRLRDLYDYCFDRGKFVIISSPLHYIPEELTRHIMYIELSLPDPIELVAFLHREARAIAATGGTVDSSEATLFQLARALQGLTLDEARHAIRRALAAKRHLGSESVPILLEEKRLLVNRTGMIEYVADGTDIDHVGGLEILKHWLLERRKLFQLRDTLSVDIVPKGVLIMGISGCGKDRNILREKLPTQLG